MIHIVYGTRAELIKLSPIIREFQKRKIEFETIDLGQHDTDELRRSLGLPKPNHYFGKSYRDYWSKLESRIFTYPAAAFLAFAWGMKSFLRLSSIVSNCDLLIVHGNTMGVPLTIFAAKRSRNSRGKPKIVHLESGFRANTKSSILLDWFYSIAEDNSDVLITTSKTAHKNLVKRGKNPKYVGNFMKEIVEHSLSKRPTFKIKDKNYTLVNSSRSIITKSNARELLTALINSPFKSYLILNPVIKNRLKNFGLLRQINNSNKVKVLDSMNFIDFLHALKTSSCVITDSTGVEEECAILKKPCIITNDFVQIPEIVEAGVAKVTGCNALQILHELRLISEKDGLYKTAKRSSLNLGDGKSTKRVVDFLERIA